MRVLIFIAVILVVGYLLLRFSRRKNSHTASMAATKRRRDRVKEHPRALKERIPPSVKANSIPDPLEVVDVKIPEIVETPNKTVSEPAFANAHLSEEDPDVVLGLKPKPAPVEQQGFQFDDDAQMDMDDVVQAAKVEIAEPIDPPAPLPRVVALFVMSPAHSPYNGYELLQTLLAVGLRYGQMNIFHRHEKQNGLGEIQFSLASAAKPGTFDLQSMGGFSTPGLSLFVELKAVTDPMQAYELMLETAMQLAEELGGVVTDERHERLTKEQVQRHKTEIRRFEQSQKMSDLFV